jgi:hypothetical protein
VLLTYLLREFSENIRHGFQKRNFLWVFIMSAADPLLPYVNYGLGNSVSTKKSNIHTRLISEQKSLASKEESIYEAVIKKPLSRKVV